MKYKVITVTVAEAEEQTIHTHYVRMGFEPVRRSLCTVRSEAGVVIREYYENVYKFDRKQRNADALWHIYRQYKAKSRELERAYAQSDGIITPTRAILPMTIVFALLIFPFFPVIFGKEFGEFTTWHIGLISSYKTFDTLIFCASLVMAPIAGGCVAGVVELILHAFDRKRRLLRAVDRIPVLLAQIEDLTRKAADLR